MEKPLAMQSIRATVFAFGPDAGATWNVLSLKKDWVFQICIDESDSPSSPLLQDSLSATKQNLFLSIYFIGILELMVFEVSA